MVYPTTLEYECSKCKNPFDIHVTPKYGQKSVSPIMNVRCPECGAKAHYKGKR